MRKVIHDDLFAHQLSELELHVPGIRQAVSGLTLKLRNDPEHGTKVQESPPLWFVPVPDVAKRALAISYVFDETHVLLLSIWIS
jgi:hypothetical protein